MKQRFFPVAVAGHPVDVVDAQELDVGQAVEHLRHESRIVEGNIGNAPFPHRGVATAGFEKMALTGACAAPQIDNATFAAREQVTQHGDGPGVRPAYEVGEAAPVCQRDAEGKLIGSTCCAEGARHGSSR